MKEEELRCIYKLEKENSELVKKVKIGIKRLLNQNDQKDKEIEQLNNIINKTINILELSAQNKGICTCYETDTIQSALKELKQEN